MKKLITILIAGLFTLASYGQSGVAHFTGIKLGTGPTAYNLTSTASYIIEKVGSTTYARPGTGTGLTAYSNADLATVFNQAITALPATGGNIFIRSSVVDSVRSEIIDDGHSNVNLIFEKGSNLIAKKNLMTAAVDNSVIHLTSCNNWVISGIEIDGNATNQVLNAGPDQSGIFVQNGTNILIEKAYIHNMFVYGVYFAEASINCGVINSVFSYCHWNAITLGNHNTGINLYVIRNDISHVSDVGVSIYGANCTVTNNYFHNFDIDRIEGGGMGWWAIGVEDPDGSGAGNLISENLIIGCSSGVDVAVNRNNNTIVSNKFFSAVMSGGLQGVVKLSSNYNIVANNIIYTTDANSAGVLIYGAENLIQNNRLEVKTGVSFHGTICDRNMITNNYFKSSARGVYIWDLTCDNNRIIDNDFDASAIAIEFDVANLTTIIGFNIWVDGSYSEIRPAITATADGLTTGIIKAGNQNLTITSANAAYIICLPAAGTTTIGTKITGIVTANGCDLRVQAAQATTVYLNGVTTNVEADIPANTSFEVTQIDATHWILKVWTALGAVTTAIVPHAV